MGVFVQEFRTGILGIHSSSLGSRSPTFHSHAQSAGNVNARGKWASPLAITTLISSDIRSFQLVDHQVAFGIVPGRSLIFASL